jgi:hypothetical protein
MPTKKGYQFDVQGCHPMRSVSAAPVMGDKRKRNSTVKRKICFAVLLIITYLLKVVWLKNTCFLKCSYHPLSGPFIGWLADSINGSMPQFFYSHRYFFGPQRCKQHEGTHPNTMDLVRKESQIIGTAQ